MEYAAPFVHQSQVQHGMLQQSRGRAPYSALRVLLFAQHLFAENKSDVHTP